MVHFENGNDALEFYKNEEFALIVSDINMPKMNGYNFIKEIRKIDKYTPIITLSSNSISEVQKELEDYDILRYLEKPLEIKEFELILDNYIL